MFTNSGKFIKSSSCNFVMHLKLQLERILVALTMFEEKKPLIFYDIVGALLPTALTNFKHYRRQRLTALKIFSGVADRALSWSVHQNFVRNGRCSERGWAHVVHPPLTSLG
jgi:hypothetical protein